MYVCSLAVANLLGLPRNVYLVLIFNTESLVLKIKRAAFIVCVQNHTI